MNAEESVVRADPAFRRRFWLIYFLVALAGVLLLQFGLPVAESYLKRLPPPQALRILGYILLSLVCSIFPAAFYMFRFGRRILAADQLPLPGSKVLKDTPIQRGAKVTRAGWFACGGAILIALTACLLVYLTFRIMASFGVPLI